MSDRGFSSGSEHTGERKSQDVYERLRVIEDALNRAPWTRGLLLDTDPDTTPSVPGAGITFVGGVSRTLKHGLGRRARGFVEVYLAGVASDHVGLSSAAFPNGISDETHLSVIGQTNGVCAILVW